MERYPALCGIEEGERSLMCLYCAEKFSEKGLADWFSQNDFERLRPELSCMAAALSTAHDCLGTPAALIPRLRGIMKYVHTLNSGMTAGLCALVQKYNEAGIPVMLLGSTAIQLGYTNRPRRQMWRTEISVSEADFPQAVMLGEQVGFAVEQTPYGATARQGKTQCVFIKKGMEDSIETTELTVNGVTFLLPDSEDLLLSMARELCRSLMVEAPGPKLVPRIMDLHFLIPTISDWEAVAATAKKRESRAHLRLILELYNSFASCLPKDVLDLFGTGEDTINLTRLFLKYRTASSGMKRLWLYTRIRNEASSWAAILPFFKTLWQRGMKKLTQEN